ncbi:FKBP-type peptidyl-prolyl cis-trans isomerase [Candidatus Saccharibacteria bacterium]|nr:FKBP-type peptidyl-prolyl cis-trans isomerase [Candidatus Saccharibacteria bacterium]
MSKSKDKSSDQKPKSLKYYFHKYWKLALIVVSAGVSLYIVNVGLPDYKKSEWYNKLFSKEVSCVNQADNSREVEGVIIEDTLVCEGARVLEEGDTARVHYTGTLVDGTKFDSSLDRGQPFDVVDVGNAPVIDGWNIGLTGMSEGGKRRLTIPADKAYGDRATGSIPANSTLIFDIELVKIVD